MCSYIHAYMHTYIRILGYYLTSSYVCLSVCLSVGGGVSITEMILTDDTCVPTIISNAVNFIKNVSNLEIEGIFRVPGNGAIVALAMQRLTCIQDMNTIVFGEDIPTTTTTDAPASKYAYLHVTEVYDTASIMNKIIGSLPAPVFTYRAFDAIMNAATNYKGNLIESEEFRIDIITSAVLTGKVLFSTTIVCPSAASATCLAQASIHLRSLAFPEPNPFFFVGVFTDKNTISASLIDFLISLLKNKFLFLTLEIICSNPGSNIGNFDKSV